MSNSDNFFESTTYKDGIFKGLLPEYYPQKYQDYINEEVALLKSKTKGASRVLETGIGIGRLIPELAPQVGELIGIDNSQFMLGKSKSVAQNYSNVQIIEGEIEHLSDTYPEDYFDFSLCVWNTFGNITDQVSALKELAKVTSKSVFITVFHKGNIKERIEFYKNVDVEVIDIDRENEIFYLNGYKSMTFNIEDIQKLAKQSGLKVVDSKILGGVILWVELSK
ncbi:MAG: methyltransferase domain-containing protein [Patescibacteria group bacterium]|jgi:ubiquinone/menaquinone biosynthesis C-methylase UbiE